MNFRQILSNKPLNFVNPTVHKIDWVKHRTPSRTIQPVIVCSHRKVLYVLYEFNGPQRNMKCIANCLLMFAKIICLLKFLSCSFSQNKKFRANMNVADGAKLYLQCHNYCIHFGQWSIFECTLHRNWNINILFSLMVQIALVQAYFSPSFYSNNIYRIISKIVTVWKIIWISS